MRRAGRGRGRWARYSGGRGGGSGGVEGGVLGAREGVVVRSRCCDGHVGVEGPAREARTALSSGMGMHQRLILDRTAATQIAANCTGEHVGRGCSGVQKRQSTVSLCLWTVVDSLSTSHLWKLKGTPRPHYITTTVLQYILTKTS